MKYFISFKNPLTHFFSVRLELNQLDQGMVELALPVWRPGRYEAANYAKNIRGFKVENPHGEAISYTKPTSSTWKIAPKGIEQLVITYDYFAYHMDAGNSWYDEDQIYINFINCMIYDTKHINEACEVHIDLPKQYRVACGLEESEGRFIAEDYYGLVDSPILASEHLDHYKYESEGHDFHIWINGDHALDTEKLVDDFKKFTDCQLEVMGEFPSEQYHFLLQALPYKFYHGVEHHNSTVICLGPGDSLNTEELYSPLMGISSHELFHAWNIIKIRPKEMMPYRFNDEVVFPTGYVAEGFTTYYGDLFLSRSHVFDKGWYFDRLNTLFKRHFYNFGRLNYSVVDSSLDLWIDGYSLNTPERKSSIYVEGAMVALCLDLMIRRKSENTKSLDDVMRALWQKFGKKGTGYTSKEIQHTCEQVYGESLDTFFKEHVYGTAPKETLVNDLLHHVGCELVLREAEGSLERYFGIRVADNNGIPRVSQIAPGSIGEKYFSLHDELIAVNDKILSTEDVSALISETYSFQIKRNYKEVIITLERGNERYFPLYEIHALANPSDKQRKAFTHWTGITLTE